MFLRYDCGLTADGTSLDDAWKAASLRSKLVVWCAIVCSAGVVCAGEGNDWLIVPGKRAGPITSKTTRADLVRTFGARNVEDDYVPGSGDSDPLPGTWVYKDQADRSLAIQWNDDKPEPHITSIGFCQGDSDEQTSVSCRWHTQQGISLGTSLKALERLNGGIFKLLGMDWDYGGVITSWNGGRLAGLEAKCGGLAMQLEEPSGEPSDQRVQLLDEISGDKEFSSSHPAMQAVNPQVSFMRLSFENCGRQ